MEVLPESLKSKITPQDFEHIILTDEETKIALTAARKHKHQKIEEEKYWKRVEQPDMPPVMDAVTYTNYIKKQAINILTQQGKKNPEFIVSEGRKEIYSDLIKYFVGDSSSSYDLNKGIMLQGNVGRGKSFILKLCSNNPRKSFRVIDCVKMSAEYSLVDDHKRPVGESMIARFRTELEPMAFDAWKHKSTGALFDDFGWEEIVKHFGNDINVMERIINGIYSASLPFSNYHITTNLTAEQIEAKYGSRITSRLREMFNQIHLPGQDLRK
jgi:hypothetical protein